MTTNAQVFAGMVESFWDFVTESPEFAALELHGFASFRGEILPVLEDGTIAATDLPAFYVERFVKVKSGDPRDDSYQQKTKAVEVHCAIVFSGDVIGQADAAFRALASVDTIEDVICSDSARNGGLAGTTYVDDYDFADGDTEAVPSVSNAQMVMFWVSRFVVTLRKQITYPVR